MTNVATFLSFSSKAYRVYLFSALLTLDHELWGILKTLLYVRRQSYCFFMSLHKAVTVLQSRSKISRHQDVKNEQGMPQNTCVCACSLGCGCICTHTKPYIALMLAHTCCYKRPCTTIFSQSQINSHLPEPISKYPRWPDPHYFTRQSWHVK